MFSCDFAKYLWTPILKNNLLWMAAHYSVLWTQATCPKEIRKDNSWIIFQFGVVVPANICISEQSQVSTWFVLTYQISHLVQSKHKFSLYINAEVPNKLTYIHIKILRLLGLIVKLNVWANGEGSSDSQKSVSFHSGVIW